MKGWTRVALASALLLPLAGCTDGPSAPEGLPVDVHGDPLPTVQGTIVDEALRPMPDVRVQFLGTTFDTTTDEDGHYAILRPTSHAEDVLVTASKPGYLTRTQAGTASAVHSMRMDFRLDPDPYVDPRVDLLEFRGSLGCQAAIALPTGTQRMQCGLDTETQSDNPPPWQWCVDPEPNLAGAVFEANWSAQTPFTQDLHAWLQAPVAGGKGGEVQDETTHASPLRLELAEAAARDMGRWTAVCLNVETAPTDPQGLPAPGLSEDQGFSAFATLFYVHPAPPGFSLKDRK